MPSKAAKHEMPNKTGGKSVQKNAAQEQEATILNCSHEGLEASMR